MMSRRIRTAKTSATSSISPPKSKTKSVSIRKTIHNVVNKKVSAKKSSPTKRYTEPTSSTLIQPRQKRLSSLTAATLLQYCSSILSPTRKLNRSVKSTPTLSNTSKTPQSSKDNTSLPRKRQISSVSSKPENKIKPTESHVQPTRSRREASSRASAMIMQQNEIERSRYNYSLNNKPTLPTVRRQPSKTIVTPKDNISPVQEPDPAPSIVSIPIEIEHSSTANIVTNKSPLISASTISKYPLLTEASLAEHNRLHETIPLYHSTKRDSLMKWTQELDSYDRLSPPYAEHEIPPETNNLINNKSTGSLITDSKTMDSIMSRTSSHLSARNAITTPAFLFPTTAYPFDIHSYYSVLPCWQYSTWPFQSSLPAHAKPSIINLEKKTKNLSILNSKEKIIHLNSKQKAREEALTFHLHTHHHHHHIHNSSSSSTIIPLSSEKSSSVINKEQELETESILKLKDNNLVKNQSKEHSLKIENDVLNLSINNKSQSNERIKKSTRRKSSPTKRRIPSGTKLNSSLIPSIGGQNAPINNIVASSPKKSINEPRVIIPISNNQNLTTNVVSTDRKISSENIPKRRSVSAATTNSITIIPITDRSLREKRTHSASNISLRSKLLINRKRSYSPTSLTLSLTNKNSNQRKKQKVSNYWNLFGKSEQRLVSIHTDKPPVFRECYSSIRHIIEKDVISSNDCIILRPETSTTNSSTPYLAKVKWFWQEPTTDEIQMSLIWYYHPEHTELSSRVKEKFLANELLASKYSDCVSVACIEDKCYVLNLNEYNRYCVREKSTNLFEHSESVGQLKSLLNKNTPSIHHRSLPAKTVGNQNIFFCRYVYDYRANRILKNPSLNNTYLNVNTTTMSSM